MTGTMMAIATVDLAAFSDNASYSDSERLRAGQALVDACHSLGFVKVTGHGLTKHEIEEALGWTKRLFDLPYQEKMKAPHPPGPVPHRGYSGLGLEKVYSPDDVQTVQAHSGGDVGVELRKISDFKVRYCRQVARGCSSHC